jgi:large subunit ribosomal protein L29
MAKKKNEVNYKDMPVAEVENQLHKTREDLFKARFRLASASLQNPMQIRVLRKEIARLETFKKQKGSAN